MATIYARIQLRRDTETNWETNDPIVYPGEICVSTDLNQIKVGNTTPTNWSLLSYITGGSGSSGTSGTSGNSGTNGTSGSSGTSGSGIGDISLTGLTDVGVFTGLAINQVLAYNGSEWINSGITSISGTSGSSGTSGTSGSSGTNYNLDNIDGGSPNSTYNVNIDGGSPSSF